MADEEVLHEFYAHNTVIVSDRFGPKIISSYGERWPDSVYLRQAALEILHLQEMLENCAERIRKAEAALRGVEGTVDG